MVISEYFFLSEKVSSKTAFAYTDNQDIVSHELIPIVKNTLELPFDLRLKSVHSKKNKLEVSCDLSGIKYLWLDYQPNNLAWPLMSGKMRMVIEENLTGKEGITWISVKVKCKKNNETILYYNLQKN
ncbi:hypothetical protein LWM68_34550 [Niabella sp. W65]|nr:hypothetical protein [Niabella sp. W65]MCH7367433.1 hypothetical protein [Niabella sp. W65]ULT43609.1 hypothetical protein KRR40_09415 [Niabella sp. I65]